VVHQCQELALRAIAEEGADPDLHAVVARWAQLLLEKTEQNTPPYDVERVADKLKARVKIAPLSTDARLLYRYRASTIFVSITCNVVTRRFSIAHECAHIVFRNVYERRIKDPTLREDVFLWGHSDVQERLCDVMAAELLMPSKAVFEEAHATNLRGKSLAEYLAQRFQVSLTAALRRLVDIGLPYVIVSWQHAARPGGDPKLRVAWSWRPSGRDLPFIPNHKSAPATSLVHRVHANRTAESGWDNLAFIQFCKREYYLDAIPTKYGVLAIIDLERNPDVEIAG
jgi:Zn-dependent peptidase ImmA (M78 family)